MRDQTNILITLRSFIVITAFMMTASPSAQAFIPKNFRVVIDPGHGGSDLGTVYRFGNAKVSEKYVTLNLAREVAQELRARGFSVILTRETDKDVALPYRTALANRLGADLFLSIHMNSSLNAPDGESQAPTTAEGIETYILNNTTDASSKRLAQLENTVLSPDASRDAEQTDVALILKDLRLDANMAESKRLACGIQTSLIESTAQGFNPKLVSFHKRRIISRRDRGVKQALFHVLLGADMPSVLLEAGFLSHPRDRAWVTSALGKRTMAKAIAESIEQFRRFKNTPRASTTLDRCKVN